MSGKDQARISGLFDRPVDFEAFTDRLPLGFGILDRDRRLVSMNRTLEALTGFDRDQVRGVPCRDVFRTSFCTRDCPLERCGERGAPTTVEGDLIDRGRRKVPVRVTSIPVRDSAGAVVGWVETVEDLTVLERVEHDLRQQDGFGPLLGRSRRMRELFAVIPVIAQTDSSVLITGETGTGKDVLAEAVHEASERARGPFVKVNCGALPDTLLESELFGHAKGAFTGAVRDKPGRILVAQGGTLYLTEVGDLPLNLQVKLLTFLDDKVIYPLGGTRGVQADVRIVAATHRDLEQMVEQGRFRQDLLYRLNVVRLRLPPLRERAEDLDLLVDHFLKVFSARFGKPVRALSGEARRILLAYEYPGNVRELRNVLEYASNVCPGESILPEHLPAYLLGARAVEPPARPAVEVEMREDRAAMNWGEMERRLILQALLKTGGRRGRAAELLGWGRSTLWRKMKQHGIDG